MHHLNVSHAHYSNMVVQPKIKKLTLIPSNLDSARRGLSALRVLRDLIGPRSEYPIQLANKLIREICGRIKTFPIQVLPQILSDIKQVCIYVLLKVTHTGWH